MTFPETADRKAKDEDEDELLGWEDENEMGRERMISTLLYKLSGCVDS